MRAANSLTRLAALAAFFAPCLGAAADTPAPNDARRDVDLVIALDVSDSMSGLIDSTKQRLWDIVNELGRAQPTPVLRVAILTYGAPDYGAQSGYVRLDLPFTRDLDAVNEKLFSFNTKAATSTSRASCTRRSTACSGVRPPTRSVSSSSPGTSPPRRTRSCASSR